MAIVSSGPSDAGSTDGRHVLFIPPTIRDLSLEGISTLMLPEIDKDGRTPSCDEQMRDAAVKPPQVITLAGVKTRIEWAWDQVIQAVKHP